MAVFSALAMLPEQHRWPATEAMLRLMSRMADLEREDPLESTRRDTVRDLPAVKVPSDYPQSIEASWFEGAHQVKAEVG